MLERSSIGVLGVITAALALAALAAQPRADPPTAGQGARALARPAASSPSAAAVRALRDGARIEVNRARAADLELLPGVGPMLARRIIAQRDGVGPFTAAEDLLRVRGIGPRTLERLRPFVAFEVPHEAGAPALPTQPSNITTTAAASEP